MSDADLSKQRMHAAGVRAMTSYTSCRRIAQRVAEELDEVTAPHRIQTGEFDDEDSVVATIAEAMGARRE